MGQQHAGFKRRQAGHRSQRLGFAQRGAGGRAPDGVEDIGNGWLKQGERVQKPRRDVARRGSLPGAAMAPGNSRQV